MITVLLPTYNSEKYIAEAISSILNQTFKDFELLIIDDGSTDSTEKIISQFKDKRIRYIYKKHTGLADTLNFGLNHANYDWIARMDADDISHPNRLQEQVKLIDEDVTKIIFSKGAYFRDGKILFEYKTTREIENIKKDFVLHSPISHSSVIYNRDFILVNGGYNTSLKAFEDYDLWLRLLHKNNFKLVPKYLVFYRIRKESLSNSFSKYGNRIIYNIQASYYKNLSFYFMINNKLEQNKYFGWREYFFGEPSKARKYWMNYGLLFYNPRILLAFFITYLPIKYIEIFKLSNVKLRIKYYLNILLCKNKLIKNSFKETLVAINRWDK